MSRLISFCLIFIILSAVYISDGLASTRIKVAAIQIPLMIESRTEGLFIDLLDEISNRSEFEFDIKVYPGKRAHKAFQSREVDMLVPFPKGNRVNYGILSAPIYTKRDFVFVRTGQPIPKNLQELSGLRLGITAHYKYDPQLYKSEGILLEDAPSDEVNMRKLMAQRLDGFLVEEHSGLRALKNNQQSNIEYDRNNPIFSYDIVLLLQADEVGMQYVQKINAVLKEIQADGTYHRIVKQYNEER